MTAARGIPPSWQTYVPLTGGRGTGPAELTSKQPRRVQDAMDVAYRRGDSAG